MLSRFLRPKLIVGSLPVTLTNGTTGDATQVMSDLNYIVNQINANAAPVASPTFTGTVTAPSGSFTSTLTVATISLTPAQSTFTGSSTDFTVTQNNTVNYMKIGNGVWMNLPTFTGTSNSTTLIITGLPAALTPATAKTFICRCIDNGGSYAVAYGQVLTNSTIQVFKDIAGNVFTNTGTKTFANLAISYELS